MGLGIHGVHVAEAVQRGDTAEQVRLIDKGGKEIQALHQSLPGRPINNGRVIGGIHTGLDAGVHHRLQLGQCFMQGVTAHLGAATGAMQCIWISGTRGHARKLLIELGHERPVDVILPAPYPVPGHRQPAATAGNGVFAAGGQQRQETGLRAIGD